MKNESFKCLTEFIQPAMGQALDKYGSVDTARALVVALGLVLRVEGFDLEEAQAWTSRAVSVWFEGPDQPAIDKTIRECDAN